MIKRGELKLKQVNWLLFALLSLTALSSRADTSVSDEKKEFIYVMKSGDSLLKLVGKYFKNASAIDEIAKINQLQNVHKIPVGQKLVFPRALVSTFPSKAILTSLDCNDAVKIDGVVKTVAVGEALMQGASIEIPKGCQAGLTLEDASTVALLSGTLIKIKTLHKNAFEKSPEVEFELLNGRVEVDVPKRQAGDAPFQVRTPSSLAGVRGTKFRVGFDMLAGNSQVEVKQGNVAAKGSVDANAKSILDNQGLAIAATGNAGEVEQLPMPPEFLAYEKNKSTTGFNINFSAPVPNLDYLLAQSTDANLTGITELGRYNLLSIQTEALATAAVFYQWTAISKTGLFGNPKQYAFCAPGKGKKSLCDVNFNMRGMQQVHMHIQKISDDGQAKSDIVNANFVISDNDQFLLKYLPSGHYAWDIEYVVNGGMKSRSSGDFELIAMGAE